MRLLTAIFILLFSSPSFAQTKSIPVVNKEDSLFDPFSKLEYDKVVAYNLNFDTVTGQRTYRYIEFGKNLDQFSYDCEKSSIRTLDVNSISTLIKIVSDTGTYGQQYADCFEPRLGFTFLEGNKPVFTILVCFVCRFLESTVALPAARSSYYDIDSYEWDERTGQANESKPIYVRRYLKGFSKAGEKKLLELCSQLQMGYCKD